MRVIYFKCVSKFVKCVSAWVTGQMRENHAICVRVGNPSLSTILNLGDDKIHNFLCLVEELNGKTTMVFHCALVVCEATSSKSRKCKYKLRNQLSSFANLTENLKEGTKNLRNMMTNLEISLELRIWW